MDQITRKTTAVFARPFTVPGFGETLPAGEYEIETELVSPPGHVAADDWRASVRITLHPRASHPGLARTLTLSAADLDHARARDKLEGGALTDFFLEDMLADPMVRLVMAADGVSESHLRQLYSGRPTRQSEGRAAPPGAPGSARDAWRDRVEIAAILAAENEGMPPRPEGWRVGQAVSGAGARR